MKKLSVTYCDITGEAGAAERVYHAPELRGALLDLGFQSVGLLESKAPGTLDAEKMAPYIKAEDLALMVEATENGEVEEVFTSHDRMIFAAVNAFFGGPVVVMRTIFENGVVVETVTRPKRGSLPAEAPPGLKSPLDMLINKVTFGSMPLWTRQDRPRWGYHVELVDTDQPSVLWQRHRQRIDELAKTLQTSTRPQDNLPLYIALSRRSHEITNYAGQWQVYTSYGSIAAFVLFMFAMLRVSKGLFATLNAQTREMGGVLAFALFAIVLAILFIPLTAGLSKLIPPLLPGPHPNKLMLMPQNNFSAPISRRSAPAA